MRYTTSALWFSPQLPAREPLASHAISEPRNLDSVPRQSDWITMHESCDTCGADYDITPATSTIHIFLDYPRANFVAATCPNGHEEMIFVTSAGIMSIAGGGFRVMFALQPSDEIRQSAERIRRAYSAQPQAPPESPYELTPHLTAELERFTKAVEAMPDDLLYDEITSDHPTNLPARWRDTGENDDKPST